MSIVAQLKHRYHSALGVKMWYHICKAYSAELDRADPALRAAMMPQFRRYEGMLGHAVLHLLGVHREPGAFAEP